MSELSNAVAIVGMSLRFPKAASPGQFWDNLASGRDCARMLDKDALLKLGVTQEKLDSPDYVYRSYELDDIDLFDARFFGISPREARMADPQLRIMLETAHECIEDSGHIVQGTNTGMYFGVADHKYWLYYNLYQSPLEEENEVAKRILSFKDFFATQLSHKLDLGGPSISLYSACSTGLLATHEACNHLLLYDCDFAIAGGCEILLGAGYKYVEGGLSSRDGHVRAFDKDASGTVFGSGVGMVMLRRLSDAVEDGDRIYAVIRSTAVNNDGSQKVGYIAPGVKGQMGVIHEAIERAGISARDISYVEAHGTGTKVGDPIEIESISKVYRKYTDANQFCAIGSVKTNVGHLSIAAGIAGLIKTALMLYHKKIPPILHFKEANPAIDFERSPFYVNRELSDWRPYNGKRIAGVSAFGVGGTNAHAILEEAPEYDNDIERRPYRRLFVLSAKSEQALRDCRARLAEFLRRDRDVDLGNVAFTLNVGRQKYDYRWLAVADSVEQLIEACEHGRGAPFHVPAQTKRQIVFMFPGQGSQYANMALQLYADESLFRQYVDECCDYANETLGVDVRSVLFPSDADSGDKINQTEFTQVSLFVVAHSLARLWMHWGVRPQAMIGHSIGEYVAACIAGVFSLQDALKLVVHRGRLMQSMPKGAMLSVPCAKDAMVGLLGDTLSIAGENSPASCVVAGPDAAVERLKDTLREKGIRSTVLRTSHAFHSAMMEPMLADYERIVRSVALHEAALPFASNVTGDWITAAQATDPMYWVAQLRQPVLFAKGIRTIAAQDSICLEIGPGATLCSLVGQQEFDHEVLAINTLPRAKDELTATDQLLTALGKACCRGVDIDWQAVYGKHGGRRISLPTYPFERKRYWIDEEAFSKSKEASVDLDEIEHPLLGRKTVASAKVVVFENIIDKDTPKFIADHRLVETVIFPGAAYTQMALEVGKYFIKNKKVKIDDIRFAQAMMLHDGVRKSVQTIATASGEGCTFEILSRTLGKSQANDAGAWVLHAKGKISPHSIKPETMAMPVLANDPSSELVPLSRYYDALKFITFGPSFRAIKRLWIGTTPQGELESLGRVELPQHLYPEVDRYSFHPVLLDAAFQVIDGPKISESGTLPVGLHHFTMFDAVPNAFYVHAVRHEHADEEYSIGEITVFSDKGGIIAKIEHYLQKEIADTVAVEDRLADVLFDVKWEQVASPFDKPTDAHGMWLVIGELDRLGDRLRSALRGSDADVHEARSVTDLSKDVIDKLKRSEIHTVVFAPAFDWSSEDGRDAFALSMQLVDTVQQLVKLDAASPPRLVIVTKLAQGPDIDGSNEPNNELSSELNGDATFAVHQAALWGVGNTVTIEHPEFRCLRADLDGTEASLDAFVADLVQGESREDQLAYRSGLRSTPRLVRFADRHESGRLRLPNGPFEIRLMRFGTFDNFSAREFIPDLLADRQVLVEMHSAALNFKETLYALGFLNPNNRQAIDFDFGMEGAGRVKRVGSGVTHLQPGDDVIVWHNGCLSSDFVVSVDKVIRKPASLSYAEAACIPTVFMTAYYALYHLAKIKAGDRVLIHAAAGGVGQVAVQIAQSAGAEIFATASQGKWAHLRGQGIEHVFDSRSLDFADQVRAATKGRGVDIVFNSLAGEFITKSFDVLAEGGRFVEIGKRDIWSTERAAEYRSDVDYRFFEIGEDVTSGGIGGTTIIHDLMVRILSDFEAGRLTPLPMTEFALSEIQQAYRYLSAGKNIGKVVVNFDRYQAPSAEGMRIRDDRTYLITGGLGALGLLSADWAIGHGAKHIVLTGRREPSETVARRLADLNKVGVDIRWICGDVGEMDDVVRIVDDVAASGFPIGGIFHCAGVLVDALIEQQTSETFDRVFKPKVQGAWNLHRATIGQPLDIFVCFSSVSAILDGGGQANYAAANAFMDRLMSYRRSRGLSGLSVNWGAWAEVGMAAQLAERRAMDTSHFISKEEAFASLEQLLRSGNRQGVVCKLGNRLTSDTKSRMLANLAPQSADTSADAGDLRGIFTQHRANSPEKNFEIFLTAQVNKVLGLEVDAAVESDTEFVALGVDSLSMTELKNAVQQGMGKPLKMATFFANPTVSRLAKHLAAEYGEQLVAELGGSEAPAAQHASQSTRSTQSEQSIEFVTLENSHSSRLLFCFPGLNGNIFDFADFASEGKSKFKVMIGEINTDISTLETDIRKLAADAISHIKRLQPDGPKALLGYSYGGVLALEVAHQLRNANEPVALLMMLDSFPHFRHRHDDRFMNFMSALITDSILAPMKLDDVAYENLARQIMETPTDRLEELWSQMSDGDSGSTQVNLDLLNSIVAAGKKRSLADYRPPKRVDDVIIHYVRAASYPRSMALAKLDGFLDEPSMRDDKYCWHQFVDNDFRVRRIDAQHNELLKAHHAKAIVGMVEELLCADEARGEVIA